MATPVKERALESDEKLKLPKPFILRRLHSLLGLWLVIYLCEHLLVNSQAALFAHDDGYGFISSVNRLESLPYIKVIEVLILGLPFLIHGLWGISYAWTGKLNAHRTDGTQPALGQYKRNRGYSWQRITSWLLVIGIAAHVIHIRFLAYPSHAAHGDQQNFMVRVVNDRGLPLVAEKLHVQLYSPSEIQQRKELLKKNEDRLVHLEKGDEAYYQLLEQTIEEKGWIQAAERKPLGKKEVLAVAPNAGSAFFLLVRETFKNPLLVILYSLFVIAASYHAFNGLWTFMITWGITLTRRSQKRMRSISNILMGIVTFLGLMAAWGTYWTIQFHG